MGAYLTFSRIKNNTEYIEAEIPMFNVVEVDYEKLKPYRIDKPIHFKGGIYTIDYLMMDRNKGDWGIWNLTDFFFYFMAVLPEANQSFRKIGNQMLIILFSPKDIIKVVNVVISNFNDLKESIEVHDLEKENLDNLKILLEGSIEDDDYIEVIWN
ncbi:MAG: hypothetical protein AB8G22_29150 [Saprospiraceae bacterium]